MFFWHLEIHNLNLTLTFQIWHFESNVTKVRYVPLSPQVIWEPRSKTAVKSNSLPRFIDNNGWAGGTRDCKHSLMKLLRFIGRSRAAVKKRPLSVPTSVITHRSANQGRKHYRCIYPTSDQVVKIPKRMWQIEQMPKWRRRHAYYKRCHAIINFHQVNFQNR